MIRRLIPLALCVILLSSCSDDDDMTGLPSDTQVTAALAGFPESSPAGGHYEIWISFALTRPGAATPRHSEAASAGKFRIDGSGTYVNLEGEPITFAISPDDPNAQVRDGEIAWQLAADCFITFESDGDDDGEPNLPGLVGGPFVNGTSSLGTDYPDAIGVDLGEFSGSFLLATPTTPETTDEAEGVWFVQAGSPPSGAALDLVTLFPNGWTYAGWFENGTGEIVPLGTFRNPAEVDSDGAGPLGGTGFGVPGSDFPFGTTGVDLSTGTVFVTLEPAGDLDGPGPFHTILRAPVGGAVPSSSVSLTAESAPSGTVEIPVGN